MSGAKPLLTIAVPTFNRGKFLEICLANLVPQVVEASGEVELVVCDNASDDATQDVVNRYASSYPALRSLRNPENIGSDRNIARCFEIASGKYVLIFSDDDVLLPGALRRILPVLRAGEHGVVFLRPYGYDRDFSAERPPTLLKRARVYADAQEFVVKIHVYCSFISANIINKALIGEVDTRPLIGTNLVQVYLFFQAVLRARTNVLIPEYLVAAKRNNSGGYNYVRVFVENMNATLRTFVPQGLAESTLKRLNNRLIFRHLPYYVLQMRFEAGGRFDPQEVHGLLATHYARVPLYWICLYPIIRLPLALARSWAWALILASRIAAGEFARIATFALSRLPLQAAER